MYCKLVHHMCDVTGDVPGMDRNDPFQWHISPKWYKISNKCDGRSIQILIKSLLGNSEFLETLEGV